jgi:polyisoprenoid-binding protein YceI
VFKGTWKRWVPIGLAVAILLVVGGPYAYIHFVEGKAPSPLAIADPGSSRTPAAGSTSSGRGLEGTWKVSPGSLVGYRVNEVLFGQSNVAVGRTSSLSGSLTVSGTRIIAGDFTVEMASVTSDQSRRDD